ncbi:MAG: addiction module antidote protein, HigA family [Deltaproteobacteria bacterium]|nr:MAG: addiction module antidote protein, HigA family [Deltaproteobacteria bacterium]RLB04829.1 MAG: addiction module antidote protein, HigA family [Deltaproteobacteria bacterium]
MIRIPTHRKPTHPGEMLLEEFLKPMGMTQKELSKNIRVPYQRINEIINGKRGISPSTALRLAKFFGTSEDFWINLQLRWDLYRAMKKEKEILKEIKPLKLRHELAEV